MCAMVINSSIGNFQTLLKCLPRPSALQVHSSSSYDVTGEGEQWLPTSSTGVPAAQCGVTTT